MRYLKSRDGIERATLHVPIRVTRDEYQWLAARARGSTFGSVHSLLESLLSEGMENERERQREDDDRRAT